MKRYWYKTFVRDILSKELMQMPHWLFHRLLELEAIAAEYGADGLLPPVKEMAWILRPVEETKLTEALQALSEVGEVEQSPKGWRLVHFEDRQKSESTDRVRKFRERNAVKRDVTPVTEVADETVSLSTLPLSDSLERGGMGEKTKTLFIPETPREAMANSDIQLYQSISGRFPGQAQYKDIIETIQYLRDKHGDELADYLKPYWIAWSTRKTKDNKPYSPSSLVWLCEWAMQGEIPKTNGQEPQQTRSFSPIPSVEETRKMLEEQNWRSAPRTGKSTLAAAAGKIVIHE